MAQERVVELRVVGGDLSAPIPPPPDGVAFDGLSVLRCMDESPSLLAVGLVTLASTLSADVIRWLFAYLKGVAAQQVSVGYKDHQEDVTNADVPSLTQAVAKVLEEQHPREDDVEK